MRIIGVRRKNSSWLNNMLTIPAYTCTTRAFTLSTVPHAVLLQSMTSTIAYTHAHPCTHTCTHMHTHTHTCTHMHAHTRTHTHAHTHTSHTCAHTHAHIHTHTHTHTHTHMHTWTHMHAHTCTHTHMHAHTHVRTHTHAHTHTCTHTCTHTHILCTKAWTFTCTLMDVMTICIDLKHLVCLASQLCLKTSKSCKRLVHLNCVWKHQNHARDW